MKNPFERTPTTRARVSISHAEVPPSRTAYFHDQKGKYHPPERMTVHDYGDTRDPDAVVALQRKEYLEGEKNTNKEITRLHVILNVIKDDPRAVQLLSKILESCEQYFQAIIKLDSAKILNRGADADVYRMEIAAADAYRTKKHTALLTDFKLFRTYLMKSYGPNGEIEPHTEQELPSTGLYTGPDLPIGDSPSILKVRRKAIGLNALRYAEALQQLDATEVSLLQNAKEIH